MEISIKRNWNKIPQNFKPKQLNIPSVLHKNLRNAMFMRYDGGLTINLEF